MRDEQDAPGPIRGFKGVREVGGACATIDPSVFERLNADPTEHPAMEGAYRPDNLLRFLAKSPELTTGLSADVLAVVEHHREQILSQPARKTPKRK